LALFDAMNPGSFYEYMQNGALIQFEGPGRERVMVGRVGISADGTQVTSTTDGEAGRFWALLDIAWMDAWTEARRLLQLPVPAPPATTANMSVTGPVPGMLRV
jgi:hypothetical protein